MKLTTFTFDVEGDLGTSFNLQYNEFVNATEKPELRKSIARYYQQLIDPWVPYGPVDHPGRLSYPRIYDSGTIAYTAKNPYTGYRYAGVQYEVPFNHYDGVHPLATDHWDDEANNFIWDEFAAGVNQMLGTSGKRRRPR